MSAVAEAVPSEDVPAPQPLCPAHPEQVAVLTCARCGRYACLDCEAGDGRCLECAALGLTGVPSSRAAAWGAMLFLGWNGAIAVVGILAYGLQLFGMGFGLSPEAAERVNALVPVLEWVEKLGAPILFLLWMFQVVRQVESWGGRVGVSPAGAVGTWFIPVVALYKPLHVMQAIEVELRRRAPDLSLPLVTWWGLFMTSRLMGVLVDKLLSRPGTVGAIVNSLILFTSLVAAALCIHIVRAMQAELDALRSTV